MVAIKFMKKFFLIVAAIVLSFSLSACDWTLGKSESNSSSSSTEEISESSVSTSSYSSIYSNQLVDDYIERILTEGSVRHPFWNTEKINANTTTPYTPYWNYIDGVLFKGLIALYEETNDSKYIDFVEEYVDYFVDDIDGNISTYKTSPTLLELDSVCESNVLYDLYDYTGELKYLNAIEYTYKFLKKQPRTTSTGSFWHKYIYTEQIWLDGLYMAMPFYTSYANLHPEGTQTISVAGNSVSKTYYQDIYDQYHAARELMFDESANLYYHGYDDLYNTENKIFWSDSETGCSENFWLRAMGWYIVSLVEVLENYPSEGSYASYYTYLKNLLSEAITGILEYKDSASNMFYQVIDKGTLEGNYLESSGSVLISYAILKAARLNLISASYLAVGKDIFDGVCDRYLTSVNGNINLGGICKSAGLGPASKPTRDGSFEYYISEPIVENDGKGFGPFIMAYSEVLKLG